MDFYILLGLGRNASLGEIKRAFRTQIARYHPDKVQHLGKEFQEMAAGRAATTVPIPGCTSSHRSWIKC